MLVSTHFQAENLSSISLLFEPTNVRSTMMNDEERVSNNHAILISHQITRRNFIIFISSAFSRFVKNANQNIIKKFILFFITVEKKNRICLTNSTSINYLSSDCGI